MKKNGYTLSEILIALGLVGVVAAVTIPSLNSSVVKSQIGPKLSKAVAVFEQANEAMLNGFSVDTITDAMDVSANGYQAVYWNNLSRYLKGYVDSEPAFTTKDNIVYYMARDNSFSIDPALPPHMQRFGTLWVDINGNEAGPNRESVDRFTFSFWNDGSLRPKGATNWEGGAKYCEWDETTKACKKDSSSNDVMEENSRDIQGGAHHWTTQCISDAAPEDAEFCAGHIFENNLKVLYK